MGREESDFPAGPCEVRWLVDRSEIASAFCRAADSSRDPIAVLREPFLEFFRENVQRRRIAEVKKIIDCFDTRMSPGLDDRVESRKVERTVPVDQRPSYAFADGMNIVTGEQTIVFDQIAIMMCPRDTIEPLPLGVKPYRTLKATEEKAPEHNELPYSS
jgi:hypothetical protein